MSDKRHQADITQVEKRGDGYIIKGTSKGKKASFFVDARSLDSMSKKEADSFMRRNVSNLTQE